MRSRERHVVQSLGTRSAFFLVGARLQGENPIYGSAPSDEKCAMWVDSNGDLRMVTDVF